VNQHRRQFADGLGKEEEDEEVLINLQRRMRRWSKKIEIEPNKTGADLLLFSRSPYFCISLSLLFNLLLLWV
jgi:hypothetical protein